MLIDARGVRQDTVKKMKATKLPLNVKSMLAENLQWDKLVYKEIR